MTAPAGASVQPGRTGQALGPRGHDRGVGDRLPRRDDRQRRPAAHRAGPADHILGVSRPRPTSPAATSRSWRRSSCSPEPSPTSTADAASSSSASVGFGLTSVLCGLAPTMEFLVLARLAPGLRGRAARARARCRSSPRRSTGAHAARAFGIWAAATSALTILGPLVGGILVDPVSWRMAFLVNVPFTLLGSTRRGATSRSHATRTRRAGSTGSVRSSSRSRSAGSRSASCAGRRPAGATRRASWPSASASAAAIAVPDPDGRAAAIRSCPLTCSGAGSSRSSTSRRS